MNFRLIHHQFDNLSGQPSALFRLKCIHAQKLIFRVVVVVETRDREWRFYFHFAANDRHIANRKLYTFIRDSFILARQWSIDIDTNEMCVLKTLNFCLVSKWLFGEIPQVLTCVCVWVCKCMVCYARLSFGLHEFIYLSISLLMGHSHVININWLTLTHTHNTHTLTTCIETVDWFPFCGYRCRGWSIYIFLCDEFIWLSLQNQHSTINMCVERQYSFFIWSREM